MHIEPGVVDATKIVLSYAAAVAAGGAENLLSIAIFAGSYALVIVVEPLVDLAVLALAKSLRGLSDGPLVTARLHLHHPS